RTPAQRDRAEESARSAGCAGPPDPRAGAGEPAAESVRRRARRAPGEGLAHAGHPPRSRREGMMATATLEVWAPARTLIRLHRHSLFHLLLQGGTREERERVARAFHHGSPLSSGPFVRIEAMRDE